VHLEHAALNSATVALANASRETLRMADMIDAMLRDTQEILCRESSSRSETVAATARCVDQLGEAIRRYLADIGDEQSLDHQREGARGQDILSAVINLEHVGDILANGLVEFSLRSLKRGKRLSAEESAIVAAMHADLIDCLRLALAVFLQGEPADAKRLVTSKNRFREFEAAAMALSARSLRAAAANHRLTESDTAERVAEESGLLLRTVRDLRRVHSHLASFAYPILHRPAGRKTAAAPPVVHAGAVPTRAL
jgi:phosphate:Na+ symporter